jgi:hypothetical protein
MSALTTQSASRAAARILEGYFRAKDGNRPHLLGQVFTPDARLEINNASASITFPAVTQGIEGIADVLVRQFGRTYENVYSFYLSQPEGAPRQFKCSWLVGMTDKQSRDVRVGCGTYEWSFVYEPEPRASGLVISIQAMQVFAPSAQSEVLAWLEQLPYPWASAAAVLGGVPALNGLSPVLSALRGP